MAAREGINMRKLLIATTVLMASATVGFVTTASAAVVGLAPALTVPTNTIAEVRMERRMMHRRITHSRMHRRMGSRQYQHRRMWGN